MGWNLNWDSLEVRDRCLGPPGTPGSSLPPQNPAPCAMQKGHTLQRTHSEELKVVTSGLIATQRKGR